MHADIYPSDHGLLSAPDVLDLRAKREEAVEDIDGCYDRKVLSLILRMAESYSLKAAARHLYSTALRET